MTQRSIRPFKIQQLLTTEPIWKSYRRDAKCRWCDKGEELKTSNYTSHLASSTSSLNSSICNVAWHPSSDRMSYCRTGKSCEKRWLDLPHGVSVQLNVDGYHSKGWSVGLNLTGKKSLIYLPRCILIIVVSGDIINKPSFYDFQPKNIHFNPTNQSVVKWIFLNDIYWTFFFIHQKNDKKCYNLVDR